MSVIGEEVPWWCAGCDKGGIIVNEETKISANAIKTGKIGDERKDINSYIIRL